LVASELRARVRRRGDRDDGRAKQALNIEHRRVRREDGGTEYQWRIPAKK